MKGDREGGVLPVPHDALVIWVITENPKDYPGEFVARPTVVAKGQQYVGFTIIRAKTLAEVRAKLPPGLICLTRHPTDDPVIVETWM